MGLSNSCCRGEVIPRPHPVELIHDITHDLTRALERHRIFHSFHDDGNFGLSQGFHITKLLGRGSSGQCWLAKDSEDDSYVALKLLSRPLPPLLAELALNEISVQSLISDATIFCTNLKEVILTPTHIALVLEFEQGGSFVDFVAKHSSKSSLFLSESMASFCFRQLVAGLKYLHQHDIVHRDIKLDNTLLSGSLTAPTVKIADYQFAVAGCHHCALSTHMGTFCYMPPELLQNRKTNQSIDPYTADVWAAGIWLAASLFGAFPFDSSPGATDAQAEQEILDSIEKGSWKTSSRVSNLVGQLSPSAINLLDGILEPNAQKRLTLADVWQHQWTQTQLPSHLEQEWKKIQERDRQMRGRSVHVDEKLLQDRMQWVEMVTERAFGKNSMPKVDGQQPAFVNTDSIVGALRIDMRKSAIQIK